MLLSRLGLWLYSLRRLCYYHAFGASVAQNSDAGHHGIDGGPPTGVRARIWTREENKKQFDTTVLSVMQGFTYQPGTLRAP